MEELRIDREDRDGLKKNNENGLKGRLKTRFQTASSSRREKLSACFPLLPVETCRQIGIEMRADVLPPCVCSLGDGEAAFEQVAVFVFGRGVRLGLVLLPKPQLGDGAAQAGIVAEDAQMALVERLQDGAAECVLEVV